jgi:hypothetical protein
MLTHKTPSELNTIAQVRGDKAMDKSLWNPYDCLDNIVVSGYNLWK